MVHVDFVMQLQTELEVLLLLIVVIDPIVLRYINILMNLIDAVMVVQILSHILHIEVHLGDEFLVYLLQKRLDSIIIAG